MAQRVRTLVLRLRQRVDPRDTAGVTFVSTTDLSISPSGDGDRFTKERILDVYNDARFTLFEALQTVYRRTELTRLIGSITKTGALTFASGSVAKPTDYTDFIGLATSTGVQMVLLPMTLFYDVRAALNPHLTDSATNVFVFDRGTTFFTNNGTFANDVASSLTYFALPVYILSDVAPAATTDESFDEKFHAALIEIASAIAEEQGRQDVLSLAKSLLSNPVRTEV